MTVTRGRPPSHGGYLAGLFDAPGGLPDLRDGACVGHHAGLPAEVWDCDASSADRELAVAACEACPCLIACAAWAVRQPRYSLSGTVAGRNHGSGNRYPGRDEDEAVSVTVRPGVLAVVPVITAPGFAASRRGGRRAAVARYLAGHRDELRARNKLYYDANRDAILAAKAARRQAHREETLESTRRWRARQRQGRGADVHPAVLALGVTGEIHPSD